MRTLLGSFVLFAAFTFQLSHAAVPTSINFQGLATDKTTGQPLDGPFDITFNLYNVDSGGSPLWSETWNGANQVTITDGVFNVPLGQLTAFGPSLFQEPLFLGIVIGTDSEMTPRQPVLSAPYALIADAVSDAAITSSMLGNEAVDTANIKDGSVTAGKINSTGLNADSVDGIDGANIITATGGGTIADANLEVTGTGQIIAGPSGLQFSDGTTQVTAAIQAIGLGSVIPVTCDPSGATTPLQDAIDALGPGGFVVLEIDGVCKENVRARRNFLEIRGANGSATDGIECEGSGPAFEVRDPIITWLSDLNVSCPGEYAVRASRNAVLGMYPFADKVTITNNSTGVFGQYGATIIMFAVETSGNTASAASVLDGSVLYLSDVLIQENIDQDVTNTGAVEIGRTSVGRITGNNTVITNSFIDAGGGNPRVGWAVSVFFNSELRLQDVDGAGGVPTITGAILCSKTSNMSLRRIAVNGMIDYFDCSGDFRDSELNGVGSFDAMININGGHVDIRGNTLDIAQLGIGDYARVTMNGSNTITGTVPQVYIENASASIEADFTFSQFHANGPGKLAIYGALSDDADASDDFHVNGMTFDLGGTINGNVYLNKHSLVNLFSGSVVNGRLGLFDKTIATIQGSVEDCIEVVNGSLLRIDDGVNLGASDPNHDPCWPNGPSVFVTDHGKLQVGSFGSGATIEGLVQVNRNSMLEIVHNSVIDGTVNLYQGTSATMLEATITGDLNIEDSAFEIGSANNSIGGNIWGRSATFRLLGGHTFSHPAGFQLRNGSQLTIDGSATLELSTNPVELHYSMIEMHPNSTLSRALNTDQSIRAFNFSAVHIWDNSNLTGFIEIDDTSQLTSNGGGTTFNGDLHIGQAPSRANFFGSVQDSFGSNDIHCDTNSVLHGILKGKTPSFAGGSISGQCDDQTTP